MSIRDTLQEKPALAYGLIGGIFVLALVAVLYNLGVFDSAPPSTIGGTEVFISEDYETYRPGTMDEMYELGANGEPKAMANVVEGDGGEQRVLYFERYNPQALEPLAQLQGADTPDAEIRRNELQVMAAEVRKPGMTEWVPAESPQGRELMTPAGSGNLNLLKPGS